MKVILGLFILVLNFIGFQTFIIPDEVPSILSVIYSNIPTLKKGTDSRLGWGFRLGDRADFQVLVELGPQKYTQPLANQDESGANKRNALHNLANTLHAQRQHEKKEKIRQQQKQQQASDATETGESSEWLQTWSQSMKQDRDPLENEAVPLKPLPGLGIGEIDAKSVIPEDSEDDRVEQVNMKNIEILKRKKMKKAPTTETKLISILTASNTPAPENSRKEAALDDVSLD